MYTPLNKPRCCCCLVSGICRSPQRGGAKKDTLVNIEATGEFVVHLISEWFVEAANHTCGEYDPGVNEMELAGLTPVPSVKVKPPRVKEAAVAMECRVRHIHEVEDASGKPVSVVVIGEVVMIHLLQAVAGKSPSGKLTVDPLKLQPVTRMGGNTYGRTVEMFDLPRPDKHGHYPGGGA